eukprot:14659490-Heterocapsa_arctica.AAC.1
MTVGPGVAAPATPVPEAGAEAPVGYFGALSAEEPCSLAPEAGEPGEAGGPAATAPSNGPDELAA